MTMTDEERQLADWDTDGGAIAIDLQNEFEIGDPARYAERVADKIIAELIIEEGIGKGRSHVHPDPSQNVAGCMACLNRASQCVVDGYVKRQSYTVQEMTRHLREFHARWLAGRD